jgi:hypothetical protein
MNSISELYACYNGTMLGFFLAGSFGEFVADRYPQLQQRMQEFLDELNIDFQIPHKHKTFIENHTEISTLILEKIYVTSDVLFEYFMIGSLSMYTVIENARAEGDATDLREATLSYMGKKNLSPKLLKRFEKDVYRESDGRILADKLHSASLFFLNEILETLEVEKDTAFVVMPFSPEFRNFFPSFYQPLLKEVGYLAIRAWGGLSSEDYQVLLGTLMRKCGAVLAELTTLNQNVLHEIGMAEGRDQWLFLIAEKNRVIPPSNLADLAIFEYERNQEGWEEIAITELAMMISLGKLGAELNENNEDE